MTRRRTQSTGRGARRLALAGALLLACGLEPAPQQQSGDTNTASLPPAGYRLVWQDDFDGATLDPARWTPLSGPRRGAIETPASVSVANGLLTLTTYTGGGVHYTGFVTSEGNFAARYGYFEARIRFHDAPGAWCAFWISAHSVDLGGDPGVNGTEIDVVEHRVTDQGGW